MELMTGMSFNPRLMLLCRIKQGGITRVLWAISRYHVTHKYKAIDEVTHEPMSSPSSTAGSPLRSQVFCDITAFLLTVIDISEKPTATHKWFIESTEYGVTL
jgi:hypothetical protein